ncbi:hypothetical protein [Hymenobacter metallicola]|uniref:Right-handed parallel beta-helix repeat-containing protein n=1 Tax=Hymenobacter metallicola TaxID=2563114 RepID=A0A4Z0Q9V5_9BACT|nr:hypothetical protein [Hymenobacter metallicola]TGE26226.1 hypothetical protein E5K02_15565 [Hymenobacter metallicola]
MKKTLTYLFACLTAALFATTSAEAKVWRVDNNTGTPGDFTTASAASTDSRVVAGDTLYFNGSATNYGSMTLSKKLVLIGPGYFLTENPETQVSALTAQLSSVSFDAGSQGSEIMGFDGTQVFVNTNNIVVRRNRNVYAYVGYYVSNVSNVFVSQNYAYYVVVGSGCTNIFITNNYITSSGLSSGSNSVVHVTQNVIDGPGLTTYNSFVYNNIMNSGSISGTGNSYNNNLCNSTQFPAGNGNVQNVTMSNVFVGTGSTDGKWKLKSGSPALGAGVNGEDCGMFGGNEPYVLSGLPAIPSIWSFSQPSVVPASGTLQIRIKANSHN